MILSDAHLMLLASQGMVYTAVVDMLCENF